MTAHPGGLVGDADHFLRGVHVKMEARESWIGAGDCPSKKLDRVYALDVRTPSIGHVNGDGHGRGRFDVGQDASDRSRQGAIKGKSF